MKEIVREYLNKIAIILLKDPNETGITAGMDIITKRDNGFSGITL